MEENEKLNATIKYYDQEIRVELPINYSDFTNCLSTMLQASKEMINNLNIYYINLADNKKYKVDNSTNYNLFLNTVRNQNTDILNIELPNNNEHQEEINPQIKDYKINNNTGQNNNNKKVNEIIIKENNNPNKIYFNIKKSNNNRYNISNMNHIYNKNQLKIEKEKNMPNNINLNNQQKKDIEEEDSLNNPYKESFYVDDIKINEEEDTNIKKISGDIIKKVDDSEAIEFSILDDLKNNNKIEKNENINIINKNKINDNNNINCINNKNINKNINSYYGQNKLVDNQIREAPTLLNFSMKINIFIFN